MPISPLNYQPRSYVRDGSLGQILRLRGRDQADAQLRSGEIQARMWSELGQNIAGGINGYMQEKREAPIRARQAEAADLELRARRDEVDQKERLNRQDTAFMALLEQQPQPDPREIVAIYGPQRGVQIAQGFHAFAELSANQVKDQRDTAGRLAMGARALSPQLQAKMWPQIRQAAIKGGLGDEQSIPEQASSEFLDGVIGWASGQAPAEPSLIQRDPTRDLVDPKTGKVVTPGTPEQKPDTRSLGLQANDALKSGNIQEYNRIMRVVRDEAAAGRAPQGSGGGDPGPLETIIGPDGKAIRVPRKDAVGKSPAAATEKSSSGVQKKALSFFNRAQQADVDLEALEPKIQELGLTAQEWMAHAPNFAQTQLGQSYTAAQRAFTEARLRKDSGAAIPPHEFENDRQTYFVQPGDSKKTIQDKNRARAAMLASLAFESGQALGEFVGDADEARLIVEGYKARSARNDDSGDAATRTMTPNLSGLGEGRLRRFKDGPFAGQEWAIVNGQAKRVK